MTSSVTFPAPLFTASDLDRHVVEFVQANPEGVRNADVGRAIGYNDTRQWFSYGILERLVSAGKLVKRSVFGKSLYFTVER
jgi:hypothetical protein